ncbi:P-loop containing nucleoside triphosphate hydrolase protein [Rhodofomes roseus]|uniref:P-loop containing nucleoside triphosphate hydrolase protein n=1 Tax=Rhodofomes roseus TaxID=34475 RepID=A0ABQ8K6B3_9APHY|nr:P-loop containing nucleoside triphosphate hydrolase protein [Rhodofomes roseus]KAH9832616.1 P-loop containing nucleoside triphosphate hydrolase protein [Rhodofomes roseus]
MSHFVGTNHTFGNTTTQDLLDRYNPVGWIFTVMTNAIMPEWLKLVIMGAVIEISRRAFDMLWGSLVDSIWVTVTFDDEDWAYTWFHYWLARHPSWRKARSVEATTNSYDINPEDIAIPGQEDDLPSMRKVSYKPSRYTSHRMWYGGCYTVVTRSHIASNYYRVKESVSISMLSLSRNILDELVLETKKAYLQAEGKLVNVYGSNPTNCWRRLNSMPKRPIESIILDAGVKELLINDTRNFLASKEWYRRRGIPFRRGYLLHGAPGSGKSSIIHSIAGDLGLDVYVLTLSRTGLDDTGLNELLSDLPERCITLLEDVDVAFKGGMARRSLSKGSLVKAGDDVLIGEDDKPNQSHNTDDKTESRVTLSGLLNALDGIGAQEGRILFATTNDYAALDPALIRPGRMDLHINFKLANKEQAKGLFEAFYSPPGGPDDTLDEKYSDDEPPFPTLAARDLPEQQIIPTRIATLPRAQSADLAAHFAEAIPEREFSMASLQGYLMLYKLQPHDAVENVVGWVEKERAERVQAGKQVSSLSLI